MTITTTLKQKSNLNDDILIDFFAIRFCCSNDLFDSILLNFTEPQPDEKFIVYFA